MNRTLRSVLAAICIGIITLCAVLISRKVLGVARVDLTERHLYTLSQGTRNILAKLNQPIKLKLFYARTAAMKGPEAIRYYNNYFLYVRGLLEEYQKLSRGKLQLQIIDPRPFSDEEEEALTFGLKRFRLTESENFFFGLVAETELGKSKVIQFFEPDRQELVEYDVSKLISGLVGRQKSKVGVISSLPVMGMEMSPYMMQMMRMQGRQPEPPWTIVTDLREEFDVKTVKADDGKLSEPVDYLMVVHPKDLTDNQLFAIDQFVMNGGKLIVFIDPYCANDRPQQNPQNPYAAMQHKQSSDLNVLLRKWGVEMDPKLITVDRTLAIEAPMGPGGAMQVLLPVLDVPSKCMNPKEVISAKLNNVRVFFAGALRKVEGTGTTVVPLISTSPKGTTWRPKNPFELQMPDPATIWQAIMDGTEPVMLACRLTGKMKTNFPDGLMLEDNADEPKAPGDDKAKKDEKKPTKLEAKQESPADTSVIVFSDADMISNMLAYQQTFFGNAQVGDNVAALYNSLDFLGGSDDLIAIRTRGRFTRPFTVVKDIEAKAEKATADEEKAIKQKIEDYRGKLRKLGDSLTEDNERLIRGAAIAERKKIQLEMLEAQRQLRELNAGKREQIEALGSRLQAYNMLAAPAVVLLIAIVLAVVRHIKAKRYVERRM